MDYMQNNQAKTLSPPVGKTMQLYGNYGIVLHKVNKITRVYCKQQDESMP